MLPGDQCDQGVPDGLEGREASEWALSHRGRARDCGGSRPWREQTLHCLNIRVLGLPKDWKRQVLGCQALGRSTDFMGLQAKQSSRQLQGQPRQDTGHQTFGRAWMGPNWEGLGGRVWTRSPKACVQTWLCHSSLQDGGVVGSCSLSAP